jgi:hypothetical protein
VNSREELIASMAAQAVEKLRRIANRIEAELVTGDEYEYGRALRAVRLLSPPASILDDLLEDLGDEP